MKISLSSLEKLGEDKDSIIKKYLELQPFGKYEETGNTRYLLDKKSLELLLQYIDHNIITVSHFGTDKLRMKYIRDTIKENTGNSIKDLGLINRTYNMKKYNFFFAYCLTPAGVELVKNINNLGVFEQDIIYYEYKEYN